MNFSNLPLSRRQSSLVLLLFALSLLLFILENVNGDSITQALFYQRDLISEGELWRIFTGHLLHTNGFHLSLNLAALTLLWALHGQFYNLKNYSCVFLSCAVSTSLGIYFFNPALLQYVGLSGVLHGIFIFGALMDIFNNDKTGYLLFIGVWLKIAHEQLYGASADVSSLIEANVAVDAHLWGAIGGLLFSIVYLLKIKKTSGFG